MTKIEEITGYTQEQIKAFTFPQRIAAQTKLTDDNQHTAVLLIDAVTQDNQSVTEGLITVHNIHVEQGGICSEMWQFRKWLSTLLTK